MKMAPDTGSASSETRSFDRRTSEVRVLKSAPHGMLAAVRKAARGMVSMATQMKARLQNPAVRFGRDCLVEWSVQFSGTTPIVLGDDCSVRYSTVLAAGHGSIRFGSRCWVGPFCYLDGNGGLQVGDDVMIGPHACIYTANHRFDDRDRPIASQGLCFAPVIVGDDVWIGSQATILAGVEIGRGAVIAAGAVVTRNVEAYTVAAGVPARPIGKRGAQEKSVPTVSSSISSREERS